MKEHVSTVQVGNFQLKYFRTIQRGGDKTRGAVDFHGVYAAKCLGKHIVEQAYSGPISKNAGHVTDIINRLAQNTVTPMVLCEIIDEMMSH